MKSTKTFQYLYSLVFMLLIILPLLFTNLAPNQSSDFDNEQLPEFPAEYTDRFFQDVDDYFSKRVGFREEAITAYQVVNDRLFSIMEHPTYMRGEQRYLYMKGESYVQQYQRIVDNTSYLKRLTKYLERLRELSGEYGARFLYVLVPDKKTIYPEYFPRGYNVNDAVSLTDELAGFLKKTDLDYLLLRDKFLERKPAQQLYNVEYDAGHWNGNGAFLGSALIIQRLRQMGAQVPELSLDDFRIKSAVRTSLQVSRFPINELVPAYTLKTARASQQEDIFGEVGLYSPKSSHVHYLSDDVQPGAPRLLIFGDSYMGDTARFYINAMSEYTFLHVNNLPLIRKYIAFFKPDFVVLETAERVVGNGDTGMLSAKILADTVFPLEISR